MKNFGYTIRNDRQIDFDAMDRKLYKFVVERENSIRICIMCGTCAATCTASNFTTISFRRIILYLRRGLNDNLKKEIESCMLCGKCNLACPRGVNTRNVILNIKKGIELYEL
ncbi:MAG: 4Fe-4S dicluster domain-containing protein [Bacteroidota bacterium]